jgi:UrcA family protein
MMSVRPTILAAAAVAACALGLAAPATALPAPSVTVSYADLNLDADSGRAILDSRIADAAEQLCGFSRPTELTWDHAVRLCQTATIAAAQPQRDAAMGVYGTVRVSSADRIIRVNRAAN